MKNNLSEKQKLIYDLVLSKTNETLYKYKDELYAALYPVDENWLKALDKDCNEREFDINKVYDAIVRYWCTDIGKLIWWLMDNYNWTDLF